MIQTTMLNYDEDTKRVTRGREEQFSTGLRSSDDTKCYDRFCPQSDAIEFADSFNTEAHIYITCWNGCQFTDSLKKRKFTDTLKEHILRHVKKCNFTFMIKRVNLHHSLKKCEFTYSFKKAPGKRAILHHSLKRCQ